MIDSSMQIQAKIFKLSRNRIWLNAEPMFDQE